MGTQSKKKSYDKKFKADKKTVSSISINQIGKMNRKFIDISINEKPATLQIDAAADISVISENMSKFEFGIFTNRNITK